MLVAQLGFIVIDVHSLARDIQMQDAFYTQ